MQLFQLLDGFLLRRYVVFPFQFPEAAVRGHHNPYRGMVVDNLFGSDFRRLGKGDLIVKPGRFHQTLFLILHVPGSAVHHKAHTVHQTHLDIHIAAQGDLGRLLGYEFGFRSSYGFSSRTLGKFILCAYFFRFVGNVWQYHQIHKAFDEGRFPGSHGSYHADVDFSAGTKLNVFV